MSAAVSPADSSACCAAMSARSDEAWSGLAMRRSTMPVRSRIHSSEVSTMRSKSALVSTRSGTYMPVPTMVAPRIASGRRIMIRLDLFPDVLVDPLFDEADQESDRAPVRAHPAAPVADEADAVHAQQGRRAVLLPVDPLLDPAQGGPQEQCPGARQPVATQLLAHHVREQAGDALGGLEHDVAGEAVGDDHVATALEHVAALDVADEVEVARRTQLGQRFEHQRVALGVLLADR